MTKIEVWGPTTWKLFHCLAEKIKIQHESNQSICIQLFQVIKQICGALPCPDCSMHATHSLKNISNGEINTRQKLVNILYLFHNSVNRRKKKHLYNYSNINIYRTYNLLQVFRQFLSVFHTQGNMQQLTESFRRQMVIKNVKGWFYDNIRFFYIEAFRPHILSIPSNIIQPKNNNTTENINSEIIKTENEDKMAENLQNIIEIIKADNTIENNTIEIIKVDNTIEIIKVDNEERNYDKINTLLEEIAG
jgi:hypothetical protein